MHGRVLIISHNVAFLTKALEDNLKQLNIQSVQVEPNIELLTKYEEGADIFLLFVNPDAPISESVIEHLKELRTIYKKKRLCIVAYSESITKLEDILPSGVIDREFLRPVDVKTLTEEIYSMLSRAEDGKIAEKHILLVDDDIPFLRIMQGWLSEQYTVTALKSGMQAITYVATQRPDLILLDYEMPITSGLQVLEMIRSERRTKDIPVIFLTGVTDKEKIMKAIHLSPNGYLLKTSTKTAVFEAIENCFREMFPKDYAEEEQTSKSEESQVEAYAQGFCQTNHMAAHPSFRIG